MSLPILKTKRSNLYFLIAASTLALAGCDGGSVGQTSSAELSADVSSPNRSADATEGNLISERSSGATVCFDVNRNGHCDRLEPNTITTSSGSFSLMPAKAPSPLLAELLADEENTALTLFADSDSQTISALTTVLHWSKMMNPTLPAESVKQDLMQTLAVDDLDTEIPEVVTTIQLPSDEAEADTIDEEDNAETADASDGEAADASQDSLVETDPLPPKHVDIVRQSIEKLIAKIDTAALEDALEAGLDPGLDVNQLLLSRLVADQTLKQLPALANALNSSVDPDPQLIVDALPAVQWPADDIVLAMQSFAGDMPTEADPIALLENGLLGLIKNCETANACTLQASRKSLDDDLNLSVENYAVLADGSTVELSLSESGISNLVLSGEGEWKPLDTSGMATLTSTSEYRAEMLDSNDNNFELRATAQNLRDSPVAPLLDSVALSSDDLPAAQNTFASGAKLVTLQHTQLNDRFEILFQPSQDTLDKATAAQTLTQAEITLDRTQRDHATANSTLSEIQFVSEQSAEASDAAASEVEALERAATAIESALDEANVALAQATDEFAAIEESADLIAAYESVLLDANDKVSEQETLDNDAQSAVSDAETAQTAATAALEDASTALDEAIAGAATDSETATDNGESEEPESNDEAVTEPETEEEDSPAVIAAEAAKLQAERDLIVSDAALAEATAAAAEATTALAAANAEQANAEIALAEAQQQQLSDTDAESVLQGAQLLVDANEANLNLIEGQIAEAQVISDIAEQLASDDLAAMLSAQANTDQLASRLITATDDLNAAQAAVATTGAVASSGCAELLPMQATDNYNCVAIERRIGSSPSSAVQTLAELTSTSSTLTLLQLHSDYAVTLLPTQGASEGQVVWHGLSDLYDPTDETQPSSQWMQKSVNGVQIITIAVPEELREEGQASELLMAEQDNYLRPGVVVNAGNVVIEKLFNEAALSALLP